MQVFVKVENLELTIDDGWLLGILEGIELGLSDGIELQCCVFNKNLAVCRSNV
jgi:hypothetical protein